MHINNEMKTIRIPLVNFGWYEVDEETGNKSYCMAKESYVAMLDWKIFGNLTKYLYEHAEDGLTAPEQRDLDTVRSKIIASLVAGETTMNKKKRPEGEAWVPVNLPFSGIIDVTSSAVVEEEKKVVGGIVVTNYYLVVPVNEEAMKELAKYFRVVDAQHSSYSFSDECVLLRETNIGFDAPVFVYLDLNAKERAELFDNKNFSAKRAPSDQKLEHEIIRGTASDSEKQLWEIIDVICNQRLDVAGGGQQFSVMRNAIKTSQKQKKDVVTKQQIYRYSMRNSKGTEARENNLMTALKKVIDVHNLPAAVSSSYAYACGINEYAIAFNEVHGHTSEADINMFVPSRKNKVSATKIAMAIAFAQPCAEIIANTEGLKWDRESLISLLTILRDNVMEGETLREYSGLKSSGGGNAYNNTIKMMDDLKTVCRGMTAKQIREKGNASLVVL